MPKLRALEKINDNALCAVLNKVFYKVPSEFSRKELAEWFLAEIADIPGLNAQVKWNDEDSVFEENKSNKIAS